MALPGNRNSSRRARQRANARRNCRRKSRYRLGPTVRARPIRWRTDIRVVIGSSFGIPADRRRRIVTSRPQLPRARRAQAAGFCAVGSGTGTLKEVIEAATTPDSAAALRLRQEYLEASCVNRQRYGDGKGDRPPDGQGVGKITALEKLAPRNRLLSAGDWSTERVRVCPRFSTDLRSLDPRTG